MKRWKIDTYYGSYSNRNWYAVYKRSFGFLWWVRVVKCDLQASIENARAEYEKYGKQKERIPLPGTPEYLD